MTVPTFKQITTIICVIRCLNSGEPFDAVARVAGVSPTTLRRQLSDAGFHRSELTGKWHHV